MDATTRSSVVEETVEVHQALHPPVVVGHVAPESLLPHPQEEEVLPCDQVHPRAALAHRAVEVLLPVCHLLAPAVAEGAWVVEAEEVADDVNPLI